MKLAKLPILFAILAAFLFVTSPATAQEVEDEREFNYDPESEDGPRHWARINPEWATCGKGKMQSPIDLNDKRVRVLQRLGDIPHTYKPGNATMKNRGHDIMIKWEEGAGGMWLNGTEYILKQVHWHSPSEHTVNGHEFAMELHMVHVSAENEIAVVGILYTIGLPDPFLTKIAEELDEVAGEKDGEINIGIVNPIQVSKKSRTYYRYMGSLTTPPCTEGVIWTISRKVRTVSQEQVDDLRDAVNDMAETNARPTQLINQRTVDFYRPRKVHE